MSGVEMPNSVRRKDDDSHSEIAEGEYNAIAAKVGQRVLMDKQTVTIPGKTSAIEVCDVLTDNRQLIHVKRKFSSNALSHLFGQGTSHQNYCSAAPNTVARFGGSSKPSRRMSETLATRA